LKDKKGITWRWRRSWAA